jgi:hypothetical protein
MNMHLSDKFVWLIYLWTGVTGLFCHGCHENAQSEKVAPQKAFRRVSRLRFMERVGRKGSSGRRERQAQKRFPPLPRAPEPRPPLLSEVDAVRKAFARERPAARLQAARMLDALVRKNRKNARLGLYLLRTDENRLQAAGLRIWAHLKQDDRFVAITSAVMGHPSDRMRHQALLLYNTEVPPKDAKLALPFVRKLFDDRSCNVRCAALSVYIRQRIASQKTPIKEILAGFADPCPAVQATALQHIHVLFSPQKDRRVLADRIAARMKQSPYYYVRCHAALALARIRAPEAQRKIAPLLAQPARSGLSVAYKSAGSWTYTYPAGIPGCAAEALTRLEGKRPQGDMRAQILAWRKKMAARGWVKAPPRPFCIRSRSCSEGKICLHLRCRSMQAAVRAYRQYEKRAAKQKNRSRRRWWNVASVAEVESGFSPEPKSMARVMRYLEKQR